MRYAVKTTLPFDKWLGKIKDAQVKGRILNRLRRVYLGYFGDYKALQSGLFELRFFVAGGIRIYYTFYDDEVVMLLCGGNKSTQRKDIELARNLMMQLED